MNDADLALLQAQHIGRVFDAILGKPGTIPAPTRDAQLRWCVFPLNDSGWTVQLGYTVDNAEPDAPLVDVERYVLQTDHRDIDLTRADFDKDTGAAMDDWCLGEFLKDSPL
jgi:hypothetical protein